MPRISGFSLLLVALALGAAPLALRADDCDPALKAANGGTCPTGSGAASAHAARPFDAAFDSGCSTVSMDTAMEHVQVRDQDGMGICYAEAGSEMVDYWRFSHGDTNYDHQTSPTHTAIDAALTTGGTSGVFFPSPTRTSSEGGLACQAANTVRSHGSCDDNRVLTSLGGANLKETESRLRKAFDRWHEYLSHWPPQYRELMELSRGFNARGSGSNWALAFRPTAALQAEAELAHEIQDCLRQSSWAVGMIPEIRTIVNLLDQDNPLVFLKTMLGNACVAPYMIDPRTPVCQNKTEASAADYARTLNRLLSAASPQPVTVDFCAKLLTHGRHSVSKPDDKDCGAHTVVVTGRRLNPATGKCQYKIRNSWGLSCALYSPDWECSMGDLWVDSQDLMLNTWGLEWMG